MVLVVTLDGRRSHYADIRQGRHGMTVCGRKWTGKATQRRRFCERCHMKGEVADREGVTVNGRS